jgi:trigger factor
LKELQAQKLGQELANSAGYKSVEEMKADLIKGKKAEYDSQIYTLLSMRLFEELEKLLTFDVPESILSKEIEGIFAEINNLKKSDASFEGKSEEELKDYAKNFAYRRTRIGLLLKEYASSKNLKPEAPDVQKAVLKRVSMFPEYMQQEMLNWYYNSVENLSSVSGSALEQKVVEYIWENEGLKISEKVYDIAEIAKLIEEETEKKMY